MGLVQFTEKQRLAVIGPGHAAVAVLERQAGDIAAAQLLDVQLVDLLAAGIQAVGQTLVVGADAERTERKEAAVGQRVGIEQQLFSAFVDRLRIVRRTRAAVVAGGGGGPAGGGWRENTRPR